MLTYFANPLPQALPNMAVVVLAAGLLFLAGSRFWREHSGAARAVAVASAIYIGFLIGVRGWVLWSTLRFPNGRGDPGMPMASLVGNAAACLSVALLTCAGFAALAYVWRSSKRLRTFLLVGSPLILAILPLGWTRGQL